MTKKQFDDFFKQRLHPLESQVPDRLFESIMQRRKKRRMLVWWTYGTAAIVLGLCLIMAGSYWSLVRPKTSDPIAQTQTVGIIPNTVADNAFSKNSIDVVKKESERIQKFKNSKIQKANNGVIQKFKNSKIQQTNNTVIEQLNNSKIQQANSTVILNTSILNTTNTSILNTSSNTTEKTTKSPAIEFAPETIIKSKETSSVKTPNTTDVNFLKENEAGNDNFLYQLQGPECFVFGKHTQARDFYLEGYGAFNVNQRTLKNRTNDFGTKYLDKRNETEKKMYGFGAGIRAVLLVNQQLAVKAGLSYSEILERFEYIDKEYEIIERDPLTGLVTTIQKGTSKLKSYNRYHSVDIPFMIGYELHNDKVGFGLDLGAAFNIGAWQKGDMFNTEDKIVSFGKNASDTKYPIVTPFQTIIGASALASLSFYYRLDPKSQLFFQPHIRYYLNSFTKTDYPLEQRYLTGGLQVGVRKKF
ncbi:MAG: hypothetical protein RLZZ292_1890 [Bacteroidota bacterium]|jgi:hypothetical protein